MLQHNGPAVDVLKASRVKHEWPEKYRVNKAHVNKDELAGHSMQQDDGPAGDVVHADVDGLSIIIHWENNFTAQAELTDEERDDCIFRGSFVMYNKSEVLVTGCPGEEEELAIQFESEKFGDALFSTTPKGHLKHARSDKNDFDEYVFYSDSNDEPATVQNERVREIFKG